MKCAICNNPLIETITLSGSFGTFVLCSISCLTEQAWKLREIQEKLSKSRSTL